MRRRKRGPATIPVTLRPGPVTVSVTHPLSFRGLDLCDGCGTRLDPKGRLSGLCPACLAPNAAGPIPRAWTEARTLNLGQRRCPGFRL
jgi:predicted amidophosphoribosyltransferase